MGRQDEPPVLVLAGVHPHPPACAEVKHYVLGRRPPVALDACRCTRSIIRRQPILATAAAPRRPQALPDRAPARARAWPPPPPLGARACRGWSVRSRPAARARG